jgi:hypothetical protein
MSNDDEAYRTKIRRAVLAAVEAEVVTDEGVTRVKTELVIQALFEAIMSVAVTACERTGADPGQVFRHVRQMARGLRTDNVQVITPVFDEPGHA